MSRGSTAVVYSDALNASVKTKHFRSNTNKETMDYEISMMRCCPPNLMAPFLHYEYPILQLQKMDESFHDLILRTRPPAHLLIPFFEDIARKCAIFYANQFFHCDLTTRNIMLLYRTPHAKPLIFFIDSGISMLRYDPRFNLPRIPDGADAEYDFCFFVYSCLCLYFYMFDDLYRYFSPFIPTVKRYFEKYHSNNRNHQWYVEGTAYKYLGWKIDLGAA